MKGDGRVGSSKQKISIDPNIPTQPRLPLPISLENGFPTSGRGFLRKTETDKMGQLTLSL